MPTYEGMAKELGVSKQTVRNWCKRLDPNRAHIDTSGETHEIDERLASMVAHEISRRRNDPEHVREGERTRASEAMAAVVSTADGQLEALRAHYEALIRAKDEASATLLAEKDARIADLKQRVDELNRQLEAERAAHESTRRELAQSRELEGFKWPWQKREIRERYMLPAPKEPEV